MFDLIFHSMAAFQQVGMLLAGAICFGIGALIIGNALYWRLRAVRVEGTIVGVRNRGGYYYPVYRYMLPSGEERESTSSSGSGSAKGMDTGQAVRLMVFADKPDEAQPAGSFLYPVVGLFFLVPGAVFLRMALVLFPVNALTFAMMGLFAAIGFFKVKKHIIPKAQRGTVAEWRAARETEHAKELANSPVKPIEDFRASPEGLKAAAQEQKQARFAVPLLILFGLGMLFGGYHLGAKMLELTEHGVRAPGHVVELTTSQDSDGHTTYYPVVEFSDGQGKTQRFKDSVGSSPASYNVGEDVTVLYLAARPQDNATIDRGWMNWLIPGLVGAFGGVFFVMGVAMLLRYRDQSA